MSTRDTLVMLVARAEFAAEQLARGIQIGLKRESLELLIDQRTEALEELAEFHRLVPTRDDAFMPPADRHVPHQRRNRKNPDAA